MNKKLKIFAKVIYYVFTMGLGILLALILPGLLVSANVPGYINEYLEKGEYVEAINLVSDVYDDRIVLNETFSDGSGIVLFKTLVSDDEKTDNGTITTEHLAYSGFLHHCTDYRTKLTGFNKTKLLVNSGLEDEVSIQLLNYASASDSDINDNILSKVDYDYVYFSVKKDDAAEIHSISFIDCDGEVFKNLSLNLNFTEEFFTDSLELVNEINSQNNNNEILNQLLDKLLKQSNNYKKFDESKVTKKASLEGSIYILIYFICIYLIGDFLVGHHYCIRFFIWVSLKIRHKEIENKLEKDEMTSVYGTDYYTSLTMKLIVPEDCDTNFVISYHNETDQIEMIFSKDKNYSVTQRVHAGTYVNAWLECPGYVSENLPKSLEVRGYTMTVEVSMRHANENELEIKN